MPRRQGVDASIAHGFFNTFVALLTVDGGLLLWHGVLFFTAWRHHEEEPMLGLVLAVPHFVTNSIAIMDTVMHLHRYINYEECEFEPAKSTNAFLFSVIGAYVDFIAALYDTSIDGGDKKLTALLFCMCGESVVCAIVAVSCFWWGSRLAEKTCGVQQPRREGGAIRRGVGNNVVFTARGCTM